MFKLTLHDDRTDSVRNDMPRDDSPGGQSDCARRAHVVTFSNGEHLGSHDSHVVHRLNHRDHSDEHRGRSPYGRDEPESEHQGREGLDTLDDPGDDLIEDASCEARRCAYSNSDGHCQHSAGRGDAEVVPAGVESAGHHVHAVHVRAERVGQARAAQKLADAFGRAVTDEHGGRGPTRAPRHRPEQIRCRGEGNRLHRGNPGEIPCVDSPIRWLIAGGLSVKWRYGMQWQRRSSQGPPTRACEERASGRRNAVRGVDGKQDTANRLAYRRLVPDPRIEGRLEDVHRQVDHRVNGHREQHESLHGCEVVELGGLDRVAA